MAEFSKQYCELHEPEREPGFDILQMANQVQPDHYIPIVCEGFGFLAIGKDEEGGVILGFREWNNDIVWRPYYAVVK